MSGFTLPARDIVLPSAWALLGSALAVATAAILFVLMTREAGAGDVSYAARAPERCAPAAIRSQLAAVAAQCGPLEVISTFRKGAIVIGTGKPSLHRFCSDDRGAADFRVRDYRCARKALANWKGGLSVDPFAVGHLHIDVRKKALRFAHIRRKALRVEATATVRDTGGANP